MKRFPTMLFIYLFCWNISYCFADSVQKISSFIISPGETMTIPDDEILSEGLVALSFDGDSSPGSLLLQVYRNGTTNGAWAVTTPLKWGIGTTSDPGNGDFRLWIEGNNQGDRLIIRNTTSWARKFTAYNFPSSGSNTALSDFLDDNDLTIEGAYLPVTNTIAPNQTIYINNNEVLASGPIVISVSGGNAPGSAALQIYRNGGGFNAVSSLAQTGNWGVGTTSEPSSGGFRCWIESSAANARLAIKNTYSNSRQLRIYSVRPYHIVPGDDFYVPAQSALYLPGRNVSMAGLAFISVDGDKSPGSAIVQVYRFGDFNGVWSLGQNGSWTMSKTSQASTGSFRMWVDGNSEYARLILKVYSSWGRNLRVYNLYP